MSLDTVTYQGLCEGCGKTQTAWIAQEEAVYPSIIRACYMTEPCRPQVTLYRR